MPLTTISSRSNICNLFSVPTERKGNKDFWTGNVVVWVWRGQDHEEVRPGPGIPSPCRVWWEGLTLRAEIRVAFPNGDHIDFRHDGETVWSVPAKIGNRRAFSFWQDFSVGKTKVTFLPAS